MLKTLQGQSAIAATATPQRPDLPDVGGVYTLQNTGASNAIYYKYEAGAATADFAGTDAVLRGLGAGKLDPGEMFVIGPGVPWLDVVCATGLTSTLEIEPGASVSAVNVEANLGNVGLLNAAESEINPATEESLAAAAADLNELTAAPVAKALTRLVPVAIAAAGTPVKLIAAETFATKLIVQAGKILGANTGLISIGTNVAYTTDLQVQLSPGDTYVVEARPGCKFDIALIYIDGVNVADGVRGQYMPA